MDRVSQNGVGNDEYSPAALKFNRIEGWLQSEEARGKEHSEVESQLMRDGMEVLRLLFQGYLDGRSAAEVKEKNVVGTDGVKRTHCRQHCDRQLETLFGTVVVDRLSYGHGGVMSLHPLDVKLNLPSDKYSHGLQRLAAEEASKVSFDEAVKSIETMTGGKVPKRQVEQLVVEAAQDFEEFYQKRKSDGAEETNDPLVLTMDGKGIVMKNEALREGTKKRAEEQQGKRKARLGKGEKRNRKRMATVASVYSIERHPRTAAEIMGPEKKEKEQAEKKPKARRKRVWASVEREPEQVTEEMFQEALHRDPERKREWAVLVDGDERQIGRIVDGGRQHSVSLTIIVDFIHVLEYLWRAAFCFFEEGSKETEAWVVKRALEILEGRSSSVAAGMRRSATLRRLSKTERTAVDTCAGYLLKYREALRYNEYLAGGLPIATGVIEGACRHLIKDRMDLTGARWGLKSAEAVLKLRSLRSSGDFQEYWKYHLVAESRRNHALHQAPQPMPSAT